MDSLNFNPGFYTKFRIDQNGNLLDVGELDKSDLPDHSHDLSEIKGDLQGEIVKVLATLFANSEDCAVVFNFDKTTGTVSADVRLDDESVYKNEYGQLASSGEGSVSSSPDLSSINEELSNLKEELKDSFKDYISSIFVNNIDSAVVFNFDKNSNTLTADVNIDGVSINKNSMGELQSSGGEGGGVSTECATHTHTSSQIEDFDEAVKALLEGNNNITIEMLSNLIDNSTIVINEYGQLASVSTAVGKHTHLLEDITDYVAPDPAAKQLVSDLGEGIDYYAGVIDFSSLNIGYSILALSQYLKDVVNKNIEILSNKLKQLNIDSNNSTGISFKPSINSLKNILYDKVSKVYKEVYYGKGLSLILDYLPKTKGTLKLLINETEVATANIENLQRAYEEEGIFYVESAYMKGSVLVPVLRMDVGKFLELERSYEFQLQFIDELGTVEHSQKLKLWCTPNRQVTFVVKDTTNLHTIGSSEYYDENKYSAKIYIQDYENYRFVNTSFGFVDGEVEKLYKGNCKENIPNLFSDTLVDISFEKFVERSSSDLYNWMKSITGGSIVNDTLIPSSTSCELVCEIPQSEEYNAIKVYGVDVKNCKLSKESFVADGNVIAQRNKVSGRIAMNSNYDILALFGYYDSGKENLSITIKTNSSLDLQNIHIERMVL